MADHALYCCCICSVLLTICGALGNGLAAVKTSEVQTPISWISSIMKMALKRRPFHPCHPLTQRGFTTSLEGAVLHGLKRLEPCMRASFVTKTVSARLLLLRNNVESHCHECGGAGEMETLPAVISDNPARSAFRNDWIAFLLFQRPLRAGMAPASTASSCTWAEVRIAAGVDSGAHHRLVCIF